jgi:hypothetical protein
VRARLLEYRREIEQAVVEIEKLPRDQQKSMVQRFLEQKLKDLAVLKNLLAADSPFQTEIERVKVSLIYDLNRLILSLNNALEQDLTQVLEAQKNDEFVQTRILTELKKNIPWELAYSLKQFEQAYTTNEIEELLLEQEKIRLESQPWILPQRVATPEVGVS